MLAKSGAGKEPTCSCLEGSRSCSGGARHQDFRHPIGHPEYVRRFLFSLSDAPDLVEPDLHGRRRASSLAPAGTLCGGEGDLCIAVCRPRGSGRVRQEARAARQPRGLGGHRHVANISGRFGCPQCPSHRQGSPLGEWSRLLAHAPRASPRCRTPLGWTVGSRDNAMPAGRPRGCEGPHRSG